MTQQHPGPYGQPGGRPGPSGAGPATKLKPRLRRIQVQIEDAAGTTWTTRGALVTDRKPRSPGAKVAGWLVAIVLAAGVALLSAKFMTWTISVIHEWWTFVPQMPYIIALKLVGIGLLSLAIGTFGKEFMKVLLGIRRTPDADDRDSS
jgi:hypothetical protein